MFEQLGDPFIWVMLWMVGVVWLAGKTDLVFVRLACAAIAAAPFGFFLYIQSRSIGLAIAIGLLVFVVLAFKLIIAEVLGRLIKRDQERGKATGLDCSSEFQRRRRKAWQFARFGFALALISILTLIWGGRFEHEAFIGFGGAIIWLTLVAFWCYRCPNCGTIPIATSSSAGTGGISFGAGVDLNPEFCCACGVRLKAIRPSQGP